MGILSWIVIGLIAGWLSGMVMKGHGFGLVGNLIVGVIGGLLGGWLAAWLFNVPNPMGRFNLGSFLIALLGSVLVLWLTRWLGGRERHD
ncbi:MAG: GlsB/YeaQ/YmgE family stress response membrane protein [Candidatus Cryosericum sp.]|nr:GlsB/YeaQ/YmgE family stress response membrane protein [bacterium]